MKLGEMSTGQLADTLILIAEPAANIATDPQVTQALSAYSKTYRKGKTDAETFGKMIGKLAPLLLRDHRNDVYLIVSALTDKTPEQIDAQKGMQTIADIKSSFDSELLDFFKSAADSERAEPSQPLQASAL